MTLTLNKTQFNLIGSSDFRWSEPTPNLLPPPRNK